VLRCEQVYCIGEKRRTKAALHVHHIHIYNTQATHTRTSITWKKFGRSVINSIMPLNHVRNLKYCGACQPEIGNLIENGTGPPEYQVPPNTRSIRQTFYFCMRIQHIRRKKMGLVSNVSLLSYSINYLKRANSVLSAETNEGRCWV